MQLWKSSLENVHMVSITSENEMLIHLLHPLYPQNLVATLYSSLALARQQSLLHPMNTIIKASLKYALITERSASTSSPKTNQTP